MSVQEDGQLTDEQLRALYAWIDAIPLSRPKRNISRDFSDGCMLAEVISAYFPREVELHNYAAANSVKQKVYNFETMNQRVLRKLGYQIPRMTIDDIVNCRPGAIEGVLHALQLKMARYREKKALGDALSPGQEDDVASQSYSHHHHHNSSSSSGAGGGGGGGMRKENFGGGRVGGGGGGAAVKQQQPNSARGGQKSVLASVDEEILLEKNQQIRELQETVEILELKIAKLEQLVRLKDNKIQKLAGRA